MAYVSVNVYVSEGSDFYAFRDIAASTQRVAGSVPRDAEGKAPIDR